MRLSIWLLGFISTVAAFCQQPAAISLQGLEGKPVSLTAGDLAKFPQHTVKGPFRIVVPAEKRPARWLRQVTALKIKQAE